MIKSLVGHIKTFHDSHVIVFGLSVDLRYTTGNQHECLDLGALVTAVKAHRVAFAFSPAARSALAFSRNTRRSNFPLGFLGIASMNSTPPLSHLY
jgi:hypothetical protein